MKLENNLIENDLMENDLIENDLMENNLIENDLMENDLIENGLMENGLMENDLMENDLESINNLNKIKKVIENMDKIHHIEILKLLNKQENVSFNENNNGTFINLSNLKNDTIIKLQNYIEYFKQQQLQLVNFEEQKKQIENYFF